MSALPIVYEIDRSMHMVYAAVGPWTPEAVSTWIAELLRDPEYTPGMRGFLNLRFTAGPLPDVAMAQRIADALRPLTTIPVKSRWAILVASPSALVRVRVLETFTSESYIQFRVFDNDAAAMTWLGFESPRNPWLKRMK